MKAKRSFGIRNLLLIVACLFFVSGCSSVANSDRLTPAAQECKGSDCSEYQPLRQYIAFGPLPYQETKNYYASNCNEQTRQRQRELANCTAVPFINILLPPPPPARS